MTYEQACDYLKYWQPVDYYTAYHMLLDGGATKEEAKKHARKWCYEVFGK